MSYVYMIQNKITGGIYIGKSNNVNKRWHQHKFNHLTKKFSEFHLYRAFLKYGIRNFSISILESFNSSEEALEAESWWVGYMRSIGAHLYNSTFGGEGGRPKGTPCTENTKRNISSKNRNHGATKGLGFDNDFSHLENE